MNVTLLTGCNRAFLHVLAPTLAGKAEYCQQHDIRFVVRPYEVNPWGSRERLMLDELPHAEWLIFLDADTILMNHRIDIRQHIDDEYECIISEDVNGLNNGVLLLKNCPRTTDFLKLVLDRVTQDKDDQIAMLNVMESMPSFKVKRVSQRLFNSYLETEYGRPDDERYSYREGDLLIHLPGCTNFRRVQLINELLPQVIR